MTTHVALVGGGLANCLIADALCRRRPGVRLTLIEASDRLGGNHLWSFHDTDVSPDRRRELEPFVSARWPRQRVRFPSLDRTLDTGYNSILSPRLAAAVSETLGATGHRILTASPVTELDAHSVTLADGERLEADLVLDGRGALPSEHLCLAYQKFVGLHLELDRPHELDSPILMDATVEQRDGYRFLYTLPLSERRLLVEDTRYADGPELDRDAIRAEIHQYADLSGWSPRDVVQEEEGVLPIVLAGDVRRYWSEAPPGVPRVGLRALLFHPTTGYSLPEAVRLAEAIASTERLESEPVDSAIRRHSIDLWYRNGFYRLLNRMLFLAAPAGQRYKVLQRFYRLRRPLIERFYAGRSSTLDKVRILAGRPPVPLAAALRCLRESSACSRRERQPTGGDAA